ncbi:hypothetical protein [Nannocystis sp.]|uniref:hypothetical protein n=1 Tax=Nannocystis sp. TaxID=1962667 RepID=UPI0025CFF8B8|nr:hypothetical protein [Nannocystis sp.]
MKPATRIRDLFVADVTRDIPPVVYFHEQSPQKLAVEVSEYIITGGYPEGHPGKKRIPEGIHEHYVALLRAITDELERPGGPDLPTCWISGFYGSGKSSFAKLLGFALDGAELPAPPRRAPPPPAPARPPPSCAPGPASRPRSIRWPSSSMSAASPKPRACPRRKPRVWR